MGIHNHATKKVPLHMRESIMHLSSLPFGRMLACHKF